MPQAAFARLRGSRVWPKDVSAAWCLSPQEAPPADQEAPGGRAGRSRAERLGRHRHGPRAAASRSSQQGAPVPPARWRRLGRGRSRPALRLRRRQRRSGRRSLGARALAWAGAARGRGTGSGGGAAAPDLARRASPPPHPGSLRALSMRRGGGQARQRAAHRNGRRAAAMVRGVRRRRAARLRR